MLVFLIWCLGSWVHQIHKHDTLFLFCFLLSFSFSSPDRSPPPFFPFLLSFFFFFFFLPQSWCFLLKPKPICLKLLSEINGSLSLAFFFFLFVCVGFCAYGVADLPWWGGGRGLMGIGVVEVWVCGSAWWRVWVCGNRRLWWVLVMVQIRVWVDRWWVAWLFGGWIGNGW